MRSVSVTAVAVAGMPWANAMDDANTAHNRSAPADGRRFIFRNSSYTVALSVDQYTQITCGNQGIFDLRSARTSGVRAPTGPANANGRAEAHDVCGPGAISLFWKK